MAKDGEQEPVSADYLRGRVDGLNDDVRELKHWKDSTSTKMTQLETRLQDLPDQVADRIQATRPSPRDQAPSTSGLGTNGSGAGAQHTGEPLPTDDTSKATGEPINAPPVKPNPAEQRDPPSGTTSQDTPPTKQRRGFLSRLR